MHKNRYDSKTLRSCKQRTKCVGCCSIYDIINDKKGLTRNEKIDYIRHKYSYYDGNYDIFFNEENRPLQLREQLNKIIEGIVDKQILPSALSNFNKKISALRKINKQKFKLEKELLIDDLILESKQLLTRKRLENSCNYKIRQSKKPKVISDNWLLKAKEANATEEEIKMIELYLDRHEILPFKINKVGYRNLISTVKLWLFNHKSYAKAFPIFYEKYEYMFETLYANNNEKIEEEVTI